MSKLLDQFNKLHLKTVPNVMPGDTIKVHQKISAEGGSASAGKDSKTQRIQVFEGVVLARKHGKGINSTITVRKIVDGVGVEKIFPVHSPTIDKIEVVKHGKVKRAKLYYLRTAKGKKARLKNKEFSEAVAEEPTETEGARETPGVDAKTPGVEEGAEKTGEEKPEPETAPDKKEKK